MKILIAASMLVVTGLAAADAGVPYPEGYRSWRHVSSMVIEAGHPLHASFGGLHHLYANDKALQGYRSGKFPDGAIIVFDLLEAAAADHAVTAGNRKVVGVMLKDAQKFAATGGWGFEGFAGDSKSERVVGEKAASACFGCHAAQKGSDFVFSRYRE
jgi:hypothetical protein